MKTKTKLNRTQRAQRRRGFAAMSPRGNKAQSKPFSPWRAVFPTAKPEPIKQAHKSRNQIVIAATRVTVGEREEVTGKYPTDENGRLMTNLVPVRRHRCTHVNMRHKTFNAPRPRDARRAAL